MRRLAFVFAAALVLAGCGGSSASPPTTTTAFDPAQIKSAYEKFFSGQTSVPDREAVLQDGAKFKSVIQAFASNPLAKNVSVTVASVKPQGANDAKVVYTVKLGNTKLPQQTGTAVRQNGSWKVGYLGLCKLVELSGTTPAVCKTP